jgi:hypothetical protein
MCPFYGGLPVVRNFRSYFANHIVGLKKEEALVLPVLVDEKG